MRILFIHGLGETESCFDKIASELPGEHVFVSLWDTLGNSRRRGLSVLDFCKELITKYEIQTEDLIIGHSTGGRLAYFIKHLNGNTIIQIASWTKDGKTKFPIDNIRLIFFLVRSGFLFLSPVRKRLIGMYRRREESKSYYVETWGNLMGGNRNCVVNQFKLALTPVADQITVEPDLRIHSKRDNIVKYPDEEFHEVPGDHFSLLTYPEHVLDAIKPVITLNYPQIH